MIAILWHSVPTLSRDLFPGTWTLAVAYILPNHYVPSGHCLQLPA
jgi:hypothetical protein